MNAKRHYDWSVTAGYLRVGAVQALGLPLALALSVVLARSLGPEQFGQYSLLVVVVTLSSLPISGGINPLLTREVSLLTAGRRWPECMSLINFVRRQVFLGGIIVAATILAVQSLFLGFAHSFNSLLISAIVVMVFLRAIRAVPEGMLRGLGRVAWVEMVLKLFGPTLSLLAVATLAALDLLDLDMAVLVAALVSLCVLGVNMLYLRRNAPPELRVAARAPDVGQVRRWWRMLGPFTSIALVATLNAEFSILLLGLMSSEEAVAGLRVASRAALMVALPLTLANTVIAPRIAAINWKSKEGRLELWAVSRSSSLIALSFSLPVSFMLILYGKPLLAFLFGDEYLALAYPCLVILIIGQVVNVAMGSVALLLNMTGHEKFSLVGQCIGLTVQIVFCFLLIPKYDQVGAAIAVALGVSAWNFYLAFKVRQLLQFRPGPL